MFFGIGGKYNVKVLVSPTYEKYVLSDLVFCKDCGAQIAKKEFSRYYYFSGDCLYLKRFYLDSLKKEMIPEEAFSTDVIIPPPKDVTIEDLSEIAGGVSLQSGRKLVIFKDLPLSSDIFTYLAKDPDILPEDVAIWQYIEAKAREVAKRVENEMEYPGQIKVNVIRETRVSDYAK